MFATVLDIVEGIVRKYFGVDGRFRLFVGIELFDGYAVRLKAPALQAASQSSVRRRQSRYPSDERYQLVGYEYEHYCHEQEAAVVGRRNDKADYRYRSHDCSPAYTRPRGLHCIEARGHAENRCYCRGGAHQSFCGRAT